MCVRVGGAGGGGWGAGSTHLRWWVGVAGVGRLRGSLLDVLWVLSPVGRYSCGSGTVPPSLSRRAMVWLLLALCVGYPRAVLPVLAPPLPRWPQDKGTPSACSVAAGRGNVPLSTAASGVHPSCSAPPTPMGARLRCTRAFTITTHPYSLPNTSTSPQEVPTHSHFLFPEY